MSWIRNIWLASLVSCLGLGLFFGIKHGSILIGLGAVFFFFVLGFPIACAVHVKSRRVQEHNSTQE